MSSIVSHRPANVHVSSLALYYCILRFDRQVFPQVQVLFYIRLSLLFRQYSFRCFRNIPNREYIFRMVPLQSLRLILFFLCRHWFVGCRLVLNFSEFSAVGDDVSEIVGSTVGVGLSSLSYTSSIITLSVTFGVGSTFNRAVTVHLRPTKTQYQYSNNYTSYNLCFLYFFIQYLLKIITF